MTIVDVNDCNWSLYLLVTFVSPAKTAEPIEMPYRRYTRAGPRNYVLWRSRSLYGKWQFLGLFCPLKSIGSHCYGVLYRKNQ